MARPTAKSGIYASTQKLKHLTKPGNAMPAPPQAMLEVFCHWQLFERIASRLPSTDLLRAQRVCRSWDALIRGLPKLKQALFLKPETPRAKWYLEVRHAPKTGQVSRKLVKIKPASESREEVKPELFQSARPNMLLFPRAEYQPLRNTCKCSECICAHADFAIDERMLTAESSARDMFLTQPPATSLVFALSGGKTTGPCNHPDPYKNAHGAINNSKGLTLDDLLQAMFDARERLGNNANWCCIRFVNTIFPSPGENREKELRES